MCTLKCSEHGRPQWPGEVCKGLLLGLGSLTPEVPINYLETEGDQQESKKKVQKRSRSEGVPGSSGESRFHLRQIPQRQLRAAGGALIPHIPLLSVILSQWLVKVRKAVGKEVQRLVVEVATLN